MRFNLYLLACVLLFGAGCQSHDDNDEPEYGGYYDPVGPAPTAPAPTAPAPMETDTQSAVVKALQKAAKYCATLIAGWEGRLAERCDYSPAWRKLYAVFADESLRLIERADLPGRNLPLRMSESVNETPDLDSILIYSCANSPVGQSPVNAFALEHAIWMLDPLVNALAEGAVAWSLAKFEDDPQTKRILDLGHIFANASDSKFFEVIDEETVIDWLGNDEDTQLLFVQSVTFIMLHELAHANLEHSMINHIVRIGLRDVINDADIDTSDINLAELEKELLRLKVATETQADIYALTILSHSENFDSRAVRLFVSGIAGMKIVTGECHGDMSEQELKDCITGDQLGADHPPLDVRVQLARRILDDGEDLRHLLKTGKMMGLVP